MMDDASVISNLLVVLNENTSEDTITSRFSMSLNTATVESATATLCNLSLYPEFRDTISRNGLPCLIRNIVLPYSGVTQNANTSIQSQKSAVIYERPTFIYATGTIRNILVEDAECRHRLRETMGLVAALSCICSQCVENYDYDGKALENCVCILRNLSFALQEVRDPAYLVRREAAYSVAATTPMTEKRIGFKRPCVGLKGHRRGIVMNLRKTPPTNIWMGGGPDYLDRPPSNLESIQGSRLLWAQDLIENYIAILRHSTNLVILEATAGAIQNLTACEWEPSAEVRSFFRSGDNVLVLAAPLISEDDGVVLTTATALRNVAEEESLRDLVAFYAMRLLIARLPVLQAPSTIDGEIVVPTHHIVSLHTASAILATLYVLVKANSERASLFLDCGGVQPCLAIAHTGLYVDPTDPVPSNRDKTVRFARFLLQTLWNQRDLQDRFKKAGLRAAHFCVHEPIIRAALKKSLTTAIWSSVGAPKQVDKEDFGSPSKPAKLQEDDDSLRIENPPDNGVKDSLLPATSAQRPTSAIDRSDSHLCPPLSSHPLPVSSAVEIPRLLSPNSREPALLPNSKSFPQLQVPLPITPQPSLRPVSRRMSRRSVVPEAFSPSSENVSTSPLKKGYFSQLNVPEVIAVHPSPRREVQIERSVSPFLRTSASNIDVKSLVPVKSQNQLYKPEQQSLLEILPKSSSSDIHRSSSVFGMQHPQGWSEAERSLSRTALLSNISSNSPPSLHTIPTLPRIRPPPTPAAKTQPPVPPTPKARTNLPDSILAKQGRPRRSSSSQSWSRSKSYRLTAPPRGSPSSAPKGVF
ncbi:Plakophilin-4 [Taenia crassiceps]|uniref:Plakophilin-4 n=1 Tax=Taenia crassiceps TaxID=6207 RepID=A0ABR4QJX0_9CEST